MSEDRSDLNSRRVDDSMDVVAEARSLRRRLLFWRRSAYLLLGLALVIAVVLGHRTTIRCRECEQSLAHYAAEARRIGLAQQPLEVVVPTWADLDPANVGLSPSHYALFVHNWVQRPLPGEFVPLAICGDSHVRLFNRGRYVLFRDEQRTYIKWIDESEAGSLLKSLPRSGRLRPLSSAWTD